LKPSKLPLTLHLLILLVLFAFPSPLIILYHLFSVAAAPTHSFFLLGSVMELSLQTKDFICETADKNWYIRALYRIDTLFACVTVSIYPTYHFVTSHPNTLFNSSALDYVTVF
jgi:hypothetical protein